MLVSPPPVVLSSTFARQAGEAARRRMEDFDSSTDLNSPRSNILQLSWDDIELQELLGQGSFSSVYKVALRGTPHDCDVQSDDEFYERVYALKCLHHKTTTVENCFKAAAVDLAMEAKLLANLLHPNIVTLWGVKSGCVSDSYVKDHGFFLLLDFLVDTLEDRLELYREHRRKTKFSFLKFICFRPQHSISSKLKEMNSFLDRLENIAIGIASAMEYLHSNRILFRDLKPQNIGFDTDGVVRIFDFGLAREIAQGASFRVMTGQAGTPRYMAPEHFSRRGGRKGGFPSDVYSFTILLWEILTLGKPFSHIKSILQLNEEVVRGNQRPSLDEKGMNFSPSFKSLFKAGWHESPELRPTFAIMKESIEREAVELGKCVADLAAKGPTKKHGAGRRKSWSVEHSQAVDQNVLGSHTRRRHSQGNLRRTGSNAMLGNIQQSTLASLAERTRKDMVDALQSERKNAETDMKRLKSILKVESSCGKKMRQERPLPDSGGSDNFVSATSASKPSAALMAHKTKPYRVQPQESAPDCNSSLKTSCDTSSTAAVAAEKVSRRRNRKRRASKGSDNFGSTAVSTFQATAVVRKTDNHLHGRESGADSYRSMNSAKSAKSSRSRASSATKKKSGPEVVLDTVQSVQQLQFLLQQEDDDHVDASNSNNQDAPELKENTVQPEEA